MEDSPSTAGKFVEVARLLGQGQGYLHAERISEAHACFQEALAFAPSDIKTLSLIGLTYFRLSNLEAARSVYEQLVAREPTNASFQLNLGLVYLKLDAPLQAIQALSRSRDLNPKEQRTTRYLGLAYARAKDYKAAYEAFVATGEGALAREMERYFSLETDVVAKETEAGDVGPHVVAATGVVRPDDAVPKPVSDSHPGVVTQALAIATPEFPEQGAVTVGSQVEPRIVLSKGDATFQVTCQGLLQVHASTRVFIRRRGFLFSSGELSYAPVTVSNEVGERKVSSEATAEPLHEVTGPGHILISPGAGTFVRMDLAEDELILRESFAFAFHAGLQWKSVNLPGTEEPMVHLSGTGPIAVWTPKPFLAVQLASSESSCVPRAALVGWRGQVAPAVGERAGELLLRSRSGGCVFLWSPEDSP